MYLDYYGLDAFPFGLTPNTSFFCDLPTHREALNVLLVALNSEAGFVKITGEVGTGKTLLCRKLLNELGDDFVTAYIPNPYIEPRALLKMVADELGVKHFSSLHPQMLLTAINKRLLKIAEQGKQVVLVIDEAQTLPVKSLEVLRLLTNLETESRKLLQIVLFGQPELNLTLKGKEIRQLKQRITFSYNLKPLDRAGVRNYVSHRLQVAGWDRWDIFSNLAYLGLYRYSRGIPRLVNILAHKALMLSYGQGRNKVGLKQIRLAAKDTEACYRTVSWFSLRKSMTAIFSLSAVFLLVEHWVRWL